MSFFKPSHSQLTLIKPSAIIFPRIKNKNFILSIDAIPGMTEDARPIMTPLFGGSMPFRVEMDGQRGKW